MHEHITRAPVHDPGCQSLVLNAGYPALIILCPPMRTGHYTTPCFMCLLIGAMLVPNLLAQSSWELIWNDEFDYTGLPDNSRWSYDVGGHGWGNREDQFYTENREENARADGDHLIIEARKEDWGGRSYTSARLVSKLKGDWTYGRIEVRAQLPSGRGTWPAIWMLPTNSHYGNGGWPDTGEIDIMEHVGYNQDQVHATIHTDAYNHTLGTQKGGGKHVPGASDVFHVYAVEWSPTKLVFSIDGVDFWTYSKGLSNWQGWPFDLDFHLIMNVAIGGSWGGVQGIDDSIFPQQMLIDYVRVYRYIDFPQVTLTAPATLEAGETAMITGTSVDPDGRILRVNLYQDDGLLETITGGASEWSWSASNVSAGCYKLRAEATDDGGWTNSTATRSLTVGNSCTDNAPYLMSPHLIEDRIEAEYFDLGGPGVAYRDISPTNEGGGIRLDEGVDIFPTTDGIGYHIGNTARREWVTYTVHVDQAGIYDLQVRLASQATQVSFSLEFDGVDKTGVFTHQSQTGEFRTVRVITENGIALDEGTQVMKLQFYSGVPKVNWLQFRLRSPTVGQAGPPLGDDFIFFVNGTNTLIPSFQGTIVEDPADPTNMVIRYDHGNWAFNAFRFPADVGVDMSQNRTDGDVLHARIWVDPANAGQPNVQLMFEDKTDGSGADDGSADLPFRLAWRIPENMRDGQWHELSIPLPPATYTELEDAKTAETLDGLDSLWKYVGAWSSGGFGVGVADELGPNTAEKPNLWKEFEWTNVQNLGVFFDNMTGGGPIYVDDLYIGAENLDLSAARDPIGAAMGVSVVATADSNMISWMPVDGADGYNVYSSVNEIIDIKASDEVSLAARVSSDVTSAYHRLEVPHASLAPLTLYYAVTTMSGFGVENTDVSMSTGEVTNEDLPVQAHVAELTKAEAEHLTDLVFNDMFDNVVEDGFPDGYMPFELNRARSTPGDGGQLTTDEDLSGALWAGYRADPPELYLYVEVTDNQITLQDEGGNVTEGWQYDSVEFGWGNYDVRDVGGGGIFTGSPHQDIMRGDFADYQFRLLGQGDGTKAGTNAAVFVGYSIDAAPQGAGAIYDQLADGSGYKLLSTIPLDQIQNVDQMDAIVPLPTGSDIGFFPFNFVLNDRDETANRDNQIQWSIKGNADGQWWNTPAQWPAVALVGREEQGGMMRADIELSEMAAGSVITNLFVNEAGSQTYYVKLTSEPSADVMVAVTGQAGTDLMLDNDGDASTDFSGLTLTTQNWNAAQAVTMMAAVDGDGDDDMVTLMHTASSDDMDYDGKSVALEVTVIDVTQTNLEDANELPKEIALDQNYPNPFNPNTLIQFALPESETVTLRVYDTLGRPVATLLNQKPYTAGTHTVRFDGAGLASGVYLYRLEVGASVLMTRYMQLVK